MFKRNKKQPIASQSDQAALVKIDALDEESQTSSEKLEIVELDGADTTRVAVRFAGLDGVKVATKILQKKAPEYYNKYLKPYVKRLGEDVYRDPEFRAQLKNLAAEEWEEIRKEAEKKGWGEIDFKTNILHIGKGVGKAGRDALRRNARSSAAHVRQQGFIEDDDSDQYSSSDDTPGPARNRDNRLTLQNDVDDDYIDEDYDDQHPKIKKNRGALEAPPERLLLKSGGENDERYSLVVQSRKSTQVSTKASLSRSHNINVESQANHVTSRKTWKGMIPKPRSKRSPSRENGVGDTDESGKDGYSATTEGFTTATHSHEESGSDKDDDEISDGPDSTTEGESLGPKSPRGGSYRGSNHDDYDVSSSDSDDRNSKNRATNNQIRTVNKSKYRGSQVRHEDKKRDRSVKDMGKSSDLPTRTKETYRPSFLI